MDEKVKEIKEEEEKPKDDLTAFSDKVVAMHKAGTKEGFKFKIFAIVFCICVMLVVAGICLGTIIGTNSANIYWHNVINSSCICPGLV